MAELRPRLWIRRSFAFTIDYALAWLLAALLLLPLTRLGPENAVQFSGAPLRTSTCVGLAEVPEALQQIGGRASISAMLCTTRELIMFPVHSIEVDLQGDEGSDVSYKAVLPVQMNGDRFVVVSPIHPQPTLAFLLMIFGAALMLRWGRSTPGKHVLGLRIAGSGCVICREVRRLGLIWGLAMLQFVGAFAGSIGSLNYAVFVVVLALALVLLAYMLIPLIRWRGAMPWDRATGFWVERG